ncbi:transcription factor MYB64-like [Dendrobium catenatum]|uniref:transcription factor MYB64-like n=1 Tax=Dendrobium catenatum TaxID=906689 RepID=UPI0009F53C07|nr:transcription factor MYB64-like [Dendrobium catenatum]
MEEENTFLTSSQSNQLLLQPLSPLIVPLESSLREKKQSLLMQREGFAGLQVFCYNNGGRVDEMDCATVDGEKSVEIPSSSSAMEVSIGIVKGQWTIEEDRMLIHLVKQHGTRKWSLIARKFIGRIGKQCRERWHNHLRPDIKKDSWTEEEESMLVQAHKEIGNKWAEIAKRIPGRTENSIKNHWNATKRKQSSNKKLRRKAIHGDAGAFKLTALQEYIKSKTLSLPDITPTATSPSTCHSSTSNEFLLQPPQPDDSELASQMVEELLSMEKPEIMRGLDEEKRDLLGCSKVEFVSQFLNTEESFPSPSNVTSAGLETQSGSNLQWDFYISNLLTGPSLPTIEEIGSFNADKVTGADGAQASPIRSADMDLMEILHWHLSRLPSKTFGGY